MHRPPVDGGRAGPVAQVQGDQCELLDRAAEVLGRPPGDVLVRGAVEAEPADRRSGRPAPGAARTGRPGPAWSGGTRCRTPRPAAAAGYSRRATSMPSALAGLCSGASGVSSRIAASTPSSTSTGPSNRSPPCTTRCPTAARSSGIPVCSKASSTRRNPASWSATGSSTTRSCPAGRAVPQRRPVATDPVQQPGREHLAVSAPHLQQLVLDGRRAGVDDQHRLHRATCAWIAVMATVFTMSATSAPRDRSLTGLARPCSTGPMATAPALRCTAL